MRAAFLFRLPLAIVAGMAFFACLLSSASAEGSWPDYYTQVVLGDGPVAFWKLDESWPGNDYGQAVDSSTAHERSHHGT